MMMTMTYNAWHGWNRAAVPEIYDADNLMFLFAYIHCYAMTISMVFIAHDYSIILYAKIIH